MVASSFMICRRSFEHSFDLSLTLAVTLAMLLASCRVRSRDDNLTRERVDDEDRPEVRREDLELRRDGRVLLVEASVSESESSEPSSPPLLRPMEPGGFMRRTGRTR